MDEIVRHVWSPQPGERLLRRCRVRDVMASRGVELGTFRELVEAVAAVGYANRRHNLFFRGQDADYKIAAGRRHKQISAILPSIYRPARGDASLPADLLGGRFEELDALAGLVADTYRASELFGSWKRIGRYEELRWALLQHYQVCPTPLTDVTQSLRVAASFATAGTKGHSGVLYVFGLPHVNGSISYHVDESLLVVKLQSICPPAAKRAHYQEGFLVGNFPHGRERTTAVNLGYRMLAKFRLRREGFWDEEFHRVPGRALMPEDDDLVPYFGGLVDRYTTNVRDAGGRFSDGGDGTGAAGP